MKKGRRYVDRRKYNVTFMALVLSTSWLLYHSLHALAAQAEFVSPIPERDPIVIEKEVPVEVTEENIDTWIREAAAKYANKKYNESYLKYQLHCLAHKESGHRYRGHTRCGDNGQSCGMYQYKKPTWEWFRKEMVKQGLAGEIGSLWDDKLQIETTAWALSEGKHAHWGPWVRGNCQ